jgi:glycosyltransferase involved in cell wall biosynthesis
MNILMLSSWFPYPPDNGSRIRVFNLLKYLSQKHSVDLLTFAQDKVEESQIKKLYEYCRTVEAVPERKYKPYNIWSILGFFSSMPRYLYSTYNKKMQRFVDNFLANKEYDIVIASELRAILYILSNKVNIPRVFEDCEITVFKESLHYVNRIKKIKNFLMYIKLKKFLNRIEKYFDYVTVVSVKEKENISSVIPANKIEIIENGVDCIEFPYKKMEATENKIIFTGPLFYFANYDAISYLIKDVYPLIQTKVRDVKLEVIGDKRNVDLKELEVDSSISFQGKVEDIKPYFYKSKVCIVPLRIGGGTRFKILTAMALGVPVISTSKGAEGLEVTSGENMLIADNPKDFADAVIRLLQDNELARKLAANARKLIEDKYDWNKIFQKYDIILEDIKTKGV